MIRSYAPFILLYQQNAEIYLLLADCILERNAGTEAGDLTSLDLNGRACEDTANCTRLVGSSVEGAEPGDCYLITLLDLLGDYAIHRIEKRIHNLLYVGWTKFGLFLQCFKQFSFIHFLTPNFERYNLGVCNKIFKIQSVSSYFTDLIDEGPETDGIIFIIGMLSASR